MSLWTKVAIDDSVVAEGTIPTCCCIPGGIRADGVADPTIDSFLVAIKEVDALSAGKWRVYQIDGPTYTTVTQLGVGITPHSPFLPSATGSLQIVDGVLVMAYTKGGNAPQVQAYDPQPIDDFNQLGDGGGTGSQMDVVPKGATSRAMLTPAGHIMFIVGTATPKIFQWQDPNYVQVDTLSSTVAYTTQPGGFGPDLGPIALITDPGSGNPVAAGYIIGNPTKVARYNGATYDVLGGVNAVPVVTLNTDQPEANAYWLVNGPTAGQYALVVFTGGVVHSSIPKVAFWDGSSWSATVSADITDPALFYLASASSGGAFAGSAWERNGFVYACVNYGDGVSFFQTACVIRIPWAGTAWEPWPSAPPGNVIVADPSDDAMGYSIMPALSFNQAGTAGAVVPAKFNEVYNFWWVKVAEAGPSLDCEFAV